MNVCTLFALLIVAEIQILMSKAHEQGGEFKYIYPNFPSTQMSLTNCPWIA